MSAQFKHPAHGGSDAARPLLGYAPVARNSSPKVPVSIADLDAVIGENHKAALRQRRLEKALVFTFELALALLLLGLAEGYMLRMVLG